MSNKQLLESIEKQIQDKQLEIKEIQQQNQKRNNHLRTIWYILATLLTLFVIITGTGNIPINWLTMIFPTISIGISTISTLYTHHQTQINKNKLIVLENQSHYLHKIHEQTQIKNKTTKPLENKSYKEQHRQIYQNIREVLKIIEDYISHKQQYINYFEQGILWDKLKDKYHINGMMILEELISNEIDQLYLANYDHLSQTQLKIER